MVVLYETVWIFVLVITISFHLLLYLYVLSIDWRSIMIRGAVAIVPKPPKSEVVHDRSLCVRSRNLCFSAIVDYYFVLC